MTTIRNFPAGLNAFAIPELVSLREESGAPAVSARSRECLGAELRAVYAELLAAPVPARFAALIEKLETADREDER